MKKVFLICTIFSYTVNFAHEKTKVQNSNPELIASWQFRTTFYDDNTSYTEMDNYYFYSDNTYLKQANSDECINLDENKKTCSQRWTTVGKNVILWNEKGKQVAVYLIKGNVDSMFKGQKLISQSKQLPLNQILKSNNDQLAINQ